MAIENFGYQYYLAGFKAPLDAKCAVGTGTAFPLLSDLLLHPTYKYDLYPGLKIVDITNKRTHIITENTGTVGSPVWTTQYDDTHRVFTGTSNPTTAFIGNVKTYIDDIYININTGDTFKKTADPDVWTKEFVFSDVAGAAVVNGTPNQIAASSTGNTHTLSLPAAITTPGSLLVSTTLGVTGATTLSSTLGVTGITTISNVTVTSSSSTGALIVSGGIAGAKGATIDGAAIKLNYNSSANSVDIASGTSTGTVTIGGSGSQTIKIGDNLAGIKTLTIGNNITSTKVTILGGTSGGINGYVYINDTAGGSVTNIGTGTSTGDIIIGGTGTQTISIGNLAAVKTVNLGSDNTTSTTTIKGGSGGTSITSTGASSLSGTTVSVDSTSTGNVNIGTSVNAKTINIGTGAISANERIINIGTNASSLAASTINIGSNNPGTTTILSNNILLGNPATGTSTTTIGNAATGNTLKIAGTTSGTVHITTDVTSGTANIFGSVAGTTNIGGASGTLKIGAVLDTQSATVVNLFATPSTLYFGQGATSGTIGYTGASSSTTSISIGPSSGGAEKKVYIGTGGGATSDTLIELGPSTPSVGSKTTINTNLICNGFASAGVTTTSSGSAMVINFNNGNTAYHNNLNSTPTLTISLNSVCNDTTELYKFKGGSFIISVYNSHGTPMAVKLDNRTGVFHGFNTGEFETVCTLTQNQGFTYSGMILPLGSEAKLFGIVAPISQNLMI